MATRETGGRRGLAGVLSDLFVRRNGPEAVERLPGAEEDAQEAPEAVEDEQDPRPTDPYLARRTSPWPPPRDPSPFDGRIEATEREVAEARAAHEQAVAEMFAARDQRDRYIREISGRQPEKHEYAELARLERPYAEARSRMAAVGDRLQQATVRLHALQTARTRWQVSQW